MATQHRFDPTLNYYAVLDVSVHASRAEIQRAYRAAMRRFHPDNFSNPEQRLQAEDKAREINAAYAVLSKPGLRQEYDAASRRTLMNETVRQRYARERAAPQVRTQRQSYAAPERRRRRRTYSRQLQRSASNQALRQVIVSFAVVAVGIITLVVASNLIVAGIHALAIW